MVEGEKERRDKGEEREIEKVGEEDGEDEKWGEGEKRKKVEKTGRG